MLISMDSFQADTLFCNIKKKNRTHIEFLLNESPDFLWKAEGGILLREILQNIPSFARNFFQAELTEEACFCDVLSPPTHTQHEENLISQSVIKWGQLPQMDTCWLQESMVSWGDKISSWSWQAKEHTEKTTWIRIVDSVAGKQDRAWGDRAEQNYVKLRERASKQPCLGAEEIVQRIEYLPCTQLSWVQSPAYHMIYKAPLAVILSVKPVALPEHWQVGMPP